MTCSRCLGAVVRQDPGRRRRHVALLYRCPGRGCPRPGRVETGRATARPGAGGRARRRQRRSVSCSASRVSGVGPSLVSWSCPARRRRGGSRGSGPCSGPLRRDAACPWTSGTPSVDVRLAFGTSPTAGGRNGIRRLAGAPALRCSRARYRGPATRVTSRPSASRARAVTLKRSARRSNRPWAPRSPGRGPSKLSRSAGSFGSPVCCAS